MHPKFWLKNFSALPHDVLRRLVWVGAGFLFFSIFLEVTWKLYEDSALRLLDQRMLIFISTLRIPILNGSVVELTALGSATLIALFTILGLVILWLNSDRLGCLYLAIGSVGAGIWAFLLKLLFTRDRPTVVPHLVAVDSYSYPSGHSLTATSFYLLLMFLAWRYYLSWKPRFVLLACTVAVIGIIGFSRLYLGVHYPSDVLSGTCFGAAWVFFLTAYFSRFSSKTEA